MQACAKCHVADYVSCCRFCVMLQIMCHVPSVMLHTFFHVADYLRYAKCHVAYLFHVADYMSCTKCHVVDLCHVSCGRSVSCSTLSLEDVDSVSEADRDTLAPSAPVGQPVSIHQLLIPAPEHQLRTAIQLHQLPCLPQNISYGQPYSYTR